MTRYKVTTDVNFRSGPGTNYEIEGQVIAGEIVQVVEPKGWLPVLVVDEEGAESISWVSSRYLKAAGDDEVETIPSKVVTGKAVVAKAMTQNGDPYVFGAEVDLKDPNPSKWDCSELVEWVCAQLGVTPKMPDGASGQYYHCKNQGTLITVAQAVKIAGALLFRIPGDGQNHVVISRGDGSTIEAKGSAYGVGVFSTSGRGWTHAAKIPGVKY